MPQPSYDVQRRQAVVEKMWLHYYNNVLLMYGLISEIQHHKMVVKINHRKT